MLKLTAADLTSGTWQTLKTHLETRLSELRQQNDAQMAEPQRNLLVGQIQEIKSLLDAGVSK